MNRAQQLDAMTLAELLAEFDRMCARAKSAGCWLYQFDPAFSTYAQARIRALCLKQSGILA